MDFEQHIHALMSRLGVPDSRCGEVDTRTLLYELASQPQWGAPAREQVDFLSKRLDINAKLHLGYLANGRATADGPLADAAWLELALALFGKTALSRLDNDDAATRLKRFNVLFKAMDLVHADWCADGSGWANAIAVAWSDLLAKLPLDAGQGRGDVAPEPAPALLPMSVVPITVLFYEGPNARAYLATFRSLGLKPQKIVQLVAAKDIATKKPVGKWLPRAMRTSYAANIQRSKIHYWPNQLRRSATGLIEQAVGEVAAKFAFARPVIDDANALAPLAAYSDRVETLLIDSLGDRVLHAYLAQEPPGAVLFTGGGIVPRSLLSLPHLRFLHIHPGFLPDIRGADCTLWSTLIAGRPSASCFYMSPGIDTGDVIARRWLPAIALDGPPDTHDVQTVYRAVYSFVDPWVRAFVLRVLLQAKPADFCVLNSFRQDLDEGQTYHFMHSRLKAAAFEKLFHR